MNMKENWKPVAVGGLTGIVMGASATYVVRREHLEGEEESQQADEQMEETAFAHVNDDMSFNEAFSAARAEMGAGGLFCWHGNVYGTYTATEWNAMTLDEKNLFAEYANNAVRSEAIETHQLAETSTQGNKTVDDVQIAEEVVEEDATADDVELAEVNHDTEVVAAKEVDSTGITSWDSLVSEDNDVRVVGYKDVELSDGHYAPMQELDINGQRVAVIDIDGDGVADMALSDLNHNNEMDEGEVIDLQTGEVVSFTNDNGMTETAPETDLATL